MEPTSATEAMPVRTGHVPEIVRWRARRATSATRQGHAIPRQGLARARFPPRTARRALLGLAARRRERARAERALARRHAPRSMRAIWLACATRLPASAPTRPLPRVPSVTTATRARGPTRAKLVHVPAA